MKKLLTTILFCLMLSLAPIQSALSADGVSVIVNAANTQNLTKFQIKNIYSDYIIQWHNGKKITVYNLAADDEARETFSQAIFGESAQRQVEAEMNRKITNTIKNPTQTKNARLVAKLVAKNPNAIGYIPTSMLKKSDKIRVVLQID